MFSQDIRTMGYTIYQSFQDNNTMDASGWIVSNNYNGLTFSTCNGSIFFGGFNKFGNSTIVSKHFSLPPHYKINLTFQFLKYFSYKKIDFCQQEYVYVIINDISRLTKQAQIWSDPKYSQWPLQGGNFSQWLEERELCRSRSGSGWYAETENVTVITYHNSESLIYIMASNSYGGWGFRDFTLAIVRCPSGCLYCSDNVYNNCYYWIGFLSLWHESIELDGWMKNDNIQPATYKCVSFDLVGGYLNLELDDKLEKIIQNLSPHYKIKVKGQIWIIDTRSNLGESFQLLVDDQIFNQYWLNFAVYYFPCGSYIEYDLISKIEVTLPHSSSQCKITIAINHTPITNLNPYWEQEHLIYILQNVIMVVMNVLVLQKQNVLLVQVDGCFTIIYALIVLINRNSIAPPMLLSQISTSQIKDLQSDDRISIEINLLEVDQQINTQGNFALSVKNQYKFLTIQVYVKCLPQTRINSLFQSNKYQDSYQYSFFLNCQQAFNTVIYNVKYEQRIIREQEMIINTSDTQCVIYQVIRVIDELPLFVKILEIILEDF